jgi:hypothetical protein
MTLGYAARGSYNNFRAWLIIATVEFFCVSHALPD